MAEEERHHAHGQQFAQAIARLAGDPDPGEQDHRVQREHDHAADESFLLGNDGEDEVVVRHGPRQVAQGILGALPPAFARQPAGADGDQRLPHIVRVVELLPTQAFPLRLRRIGRSVILAEIDQQPPPLVILQLDLPVRRREQDVHQEQTLQAIPTPAQQPQQIPPRGPGHEHHGQAGRQQAPAPSPVRLLQDQHERQQHHAQRLPERRDHPQFLHRPAQEMCLRQDEGQLGEFRGLKLKKPRSIQRRAPNRTVPKISTATSMNTEPQ